MYRSIYPPSYHTLSYSCYMYYTYLHYKAHKTVLYFLLWIYCELYRNKNKRYFIFTHIFIIYIWYSSGIPESLRFPLISFFSIWCTFIYLWKKFFLWCTFSTNLVVTNFLVFHDLKLSLFHFYSWRIFWWIWNSVLAAIFFNT